MKRLLVISVFCLGFTTLTTAQEKKEWPNIAQTDKGKWFIQTDLTDAFSSSFKNPTTSFDTSGNFGLSGGYFIKKNFAITTSIGYLKKGNYSLLAYNIGAKKYFKNNIFVSADVGGRHYKGSILLQSRVTSIKNNEFEAAVNIVYAWFIGDFLSIEPSLRFKNKQYFNKNFNLKGALNLDVSIHF